jgi:hypothetical protein
MDTWLLKGDIFDVFLTQLSDSSVGIMTRPLGLPFLPVIHYIDIDIFVTLQLGCHPVAAVQYTFTHRTVATRWQQYSTHLHTEQHKTFRKSAGRALSLRVLPWHFPYN